VVDTALEAEVAGGHTPDPEAATAQDGDRVVEGTALAGDRAPDPDGDHMDLEAAATTGTAAGDRTAGGRDGTMTPLHRGGGG
jgi:hypothetical protein